MKYKIISIEEKNKVVKFEATFDDGSVVVKRMMASLESEEALETDITNWMNQYSVDKQNDVVSQKVKDMIGKSVQVELSNIQETLVDEPIKG